MRDFEEAIDEAAFSWVVHRSGIGSECASVRDDTNVVEELFGVSEHVWWDGFG